MSAFAALMPAGAAVAEARIATPGRSAEFAAGRACAAQALAATTGEAAAPVPVGPHGAPLFPDGLLGSITHDAGIAAAAVVRTGAIAGFGIDLHRIRPLPGELAALIGTAAERREAARAAGEAGVGLLHALKEAVFKAVQPPTGRWLEYDDIEVRLGPAGRCRIRVRDLAPVQARFRLDQGVVRAAAVLLR